MEGACASHTIPWSCSHTTPGPTSLPLVPFHTPCPAPTPLSRSYLDGARQPLDHPILLRSRELIQLGHPP